MKTNGQPEPLSLVRALHGLRCWYVSTGGAAGNTFQLALGKRIARARPLINRAHTDEYRQFEGEANLLVWCAWRLDGPDGPLASWDSPQAQVRQHLDKLVGAAVEAVTVVPPAWELTVRFSDGLTLRVFCDHVPPDSSFDGNWDLFLPTVALYAGPGTALRVETSAEPALPVTE